MWTYEIHDEHATITLEDGTTITVTPAEHSPTVTWDGTPPAETPPPRVPDEPGE